MKKYTISKIKEIADTKNIILLSTEYKNRKNHLIFNCKIHGNFSTSLNSFLQSHGCPKCGYQIGASKQKTDINKVKALFIEKGYVPLFNNYERAKEPLLYKCPKHGILKISYDNLKHGKGCRACAYEKISNSNKISKEEFDKLVKELYKKNIKVLFTYKEYVGLKESNNFECLIHGPFISNLDRLKYAAGCSKCTWHKSDMQDELLDFIKKIDPDVLKDTRKVLKPREVDIYSDKHKIGIEFCGLWWHSENYKNKNYHYDKLKSARNISVRLITIFEDEWIERKKQVLSYLKSLFKINNNKIMARKTELREVNKKEAYRFLEENHIQGKAAFVIAYGLYYENSLIAIVTGNKHHRQGFENILVLNRLAFKEDFTISGGASKLLRALIVYAKENGYSKLISWSDNRWSEGNVYEKIGFKLEKELKPDYSYVKKEKRISKQKMTKKKLLKLNAVGNTEHEMALSLNLYRIWDCGKKRWVILLK